MASIFPQSDPRPPKRARAESDPQAGPPLVRSTDIWLEDGNIILRTDGDDAATIYKVHKSTLALNAVFFRDLFDGPQDAFVAGSETYDGLPVIKMPDNAEDVKQFLNAIYFPIYMEDLVSYLEAGIRKHRFTPAYASILRIAIKYDATVLKDKLARILQMEWPSTLANWERHTLLSTERQDHADVVGPN